MGVHIVVLGALEGVCGVVLSTPLPFCISARDAQASVRVYHSPGCLHRAPDKKYFVCRLSYLNVFEAADDIGVCDIEGATGLIENPG